MNVGKVYRNKIKAKVDLWDKLISLESIAYSETSHVVGCMEYGDNFLLVDIKRGDVTDTTYLKVMVGEQMGWFGCDEETIKSRSLWSNYFDELRSEDYI